MSLRRPESAWERHKREQLLRLAKISPAERLRWLEEAQRFVALVRGQRKKRGA